MPTDHSAKIIELFHSDNYSNSVKVFLLRSLGRIDGDEAFTLILKTIGTKKSQALLIAASEALVYMMRLGNLSSANLVELNLLLENSYNDLVFLNDAYRKLGDASTQVQNLFLDILRFYTGIYILLLGLRYGVQSLAHVANIFFYQDKQVSGESWELLEVVLPKEKFIRVKELLATPFSEIKFDNQPLSKEMMIKLLNQDPWVRSLTLLHAKDQYDIGEDMSAQDNLYIAQFNTIIFLKKMEFFQDIPANSLVGITEIVHEENFYPGETLVKEGEKGDSMYLICQGHVSIQKNGKEDAQRGPGECIGEMSLLDQLLRAATVIALDQVQALKIYADDFNEILVDYPEIATNLLKILSKRLRSSGS